MKIYTSEVDCLKAEIRQLNSELTEVYGLLGLAHLTIKQHLEYGFNKKTAQSTLISVGRYYTRLKTEIEKNHEKANITI